MVVCFASGHRVVSVPHPNLLDWPGDVISTGTLSGVGIFRDPPVVLKAGDMVECEISGIGTLRNEWVA